MPTNKNEVMQTIGWIEVHNAKGDNETISKKYDLTFRMVGATFYILLLWYCFMLCTNFRQSNQTTQFCHNTHTMHAQRFATWSTEWYNTIADLISRCSMVCSKPNDKLTNRWLKYQKWSEMLDNWRNACLSLYLYRFGLIWFSMQ